MPRPYLADTGQKPSEWVLLHSHPKTNKREASSPGTAYVQVELTRLLTSPWRRHHSETYCGRSRNSGMAEGRRGRTTPAGKHRAHCCVAKAGMQPQRRNGAAASAWVNRHTRHPTTTQTTGSPNRLDPSTRNKHTTPNALQKQPEPRETSRRNSARPGARRGTPTARCPGPRNDGMGEICGGCATRATEWLHVYSRKFRMPSRSWVFGAGLAPSPSTTWTSPLDDTKESAPAANQWGGTQRAHGAQGTHATPRAPTGCCAPCWQ